MNQITRIRERFAELGIDGMLITSPTNRRYMTDFTGTAGVVLISMDEAKLLVDTRYVEQAIGQAVQYDVIQYKDSRVPYETVSTEANRMGITKLGFEQNFLTFSAYTKYKELMKAELIPTDEAVEHLRMVKTTDEIAKLRTAAEIVDYAFSKIVEFIRPGVTEKAIANHLEFTMRQQGAESSSFDIIVASGYRSALPHGVASDKEVATGEMVTLDFGATYSGYRSDLTRTVAVGDPGEQLKEIYQIVLDAELATIQTLRAGISCKEVDDMAHEFISKRGYGPYFGHGTGHGIGLDIHEEPFFAARSVKKLEAGMVMTVEPGIYIPKLGGVRIEDDVLITATGYEVITSAPKNLITL